MVVLTEDLLMEEGEEDEQEVVVAEEEVEVGVGFFQVMADQ